MSEFSEQDISFMRQAIIEAKKAMERDEVPVGCVIVGGDKIIARGHNLTELLNDATAHAEMQAITAATASLGGKYLTDCTIYVTLEPCVMCAGALNWSQITKIVSGAADPKRGFMRYGLNLLHPKTKYISGLLEPECASLLQDFFRRKRVT